MLTDLFVRKTKRVGSYEDRHGLVLLIEPEGRHWLWRGEVNGEACDYRFGSYPDTRLAAARKRAFALRLAAAHGIQPEDVEWPPPPTFKWMADGMIQGGRWGEAGDKRRAIRGDLFRYQMYPKIGDMPLRDITKWHVMWCLDPGWRLDDKTTHALESIWEVMEEAVSEGLAPLNPAPRELIAKCLNADRHWWIRDRRPPWLR